MIIVRISSPPDVIVFRFISPQDPVLSPTACEVFHKWLPARAFEDFIEFIASLAVLPFHLRNQIHLYSARFAGLHSVVSNPKEHKFSHVSEVESNSPPMRPSVFPNFVGYDIGFVVKAPCLQNFYSVRDERILHA